MSLLPVSDLCRPMRLHTLCVYVLIKSSRPNRLHATIAFCFKTSLTVENSLRRHWHHLSSSPMKLQQRHDTLTVRPCAATANKRLQVSHFTAWIDPKLDAAHGCTQYAQRRLTNSHKQQTSVITHTVSSCYAVMPIRNNRQLDQVDPIVSNTHHRNWYHIIRFA